MAQPAPLAPWETEQTAPPAPWETAAQPAAPLAPWETNTQNAPPVVPRGLSSHVPAAQVPPPEPAVQPAPKNPWAGVDVDALRAGIPGAIAPLKPLPPAPVDSRSIMDRAVEAYRNAPRNAPAGGNALTDIVPEYQQDVQGAIDAMKGGASRLMNPKSGWDIPAGALQALGGGVGYVFAPVTAASTALAGNPVERLTGVPADYTDTAVLTAAPGVGVTPLVTRSTREMVAATPQARRAAQSAAGKQPPPGGQPPPPPPGGGTPLGTAAASFRPTPAAPAPAIQEAAKTIEKFLSPSTVNASSRTAANLFRQEKGIAARQDEIYSTILKGVRDEIDTADQATRNAFINYVEGRSAGAQNPFPQTQALADSWRTIANDIENRVQQIRRVGNMDFIEDYFPHMWKDEARAKQWMATAGQGSGGFTKKRTLQLYADGLAAGLEPKYANPVDAMEAYFANANRFIAHEKIFEDAKRLGHVKYLTNKTYQRLDRQGVELVPLQGRLGRTMGGPVTYTAYANPDFARVYNNMVGKGWTDASGDMIRGARQVSNNITALELGLSGFHAFTTVSESLVSQAANAITAAMRGRPITAAAEAVKTPFAPVLDTIKGAKLGSEYAKPGTGSPLTQQITDILTRAGARPGKQDAIHFGSERRGYLRGGMGAINAAAQGNIGESLRRAAQTVKNTVADFGDDVTEGFRAPGDYGRRAMSNAGVQAVSNMFTVAGNVLDTAMAPLFKVVVPTLKNGAMYRMIENFLEAYPSATNDEIMEYARRVVDSIDNRFGEMVTDNVAYTRMAKEGAQVLLRSGPYAYGQLARELGGGMADFISMPFRKGGKATPLWTEKMSYLVAMPIIQGSVAAATMYAMTGKWPSELMDFYKPQSGGELEDGSPERINMPGMIKELVEPMNKGVVEHFKGKLSTAAMTAAELATNQDWRREKIWYSDEERAMHPRGKELDPAAVAITKHLLQKLIPITIRQMAEEDPPKTAITPAMEAFGFQRSSKSASNPDKQEGFLRYRTKQEIGKKIKRKDEQERWRKKREQREQGGGG